MRPLTVTYPDGTTEQNIYTNLDLTLHKDRLNHWTRSFYDSNRQLIAVEDSAGRVTNFSRCFCGALNAMIDANGNKTSWTWDLEGRLTAKIYADNSATHYTYSTTTSRLASMTDAKGRLRHMPTTSTTPSRMSPTQTPSFPRKVLRLLMIRIIRGS